METLSCSTRWICRINSFISSGTDTIELTITFSGN